MLLNFIPQFLPLAYLLSYFFIYVFLACKVNDYLFSSDIYSRLDLNLFPFDLLHFSWTHINYLFVLLPLFLLSTLYGSLLSSLRLAATFILIYSTLGISYTLAWHTMSFSTVELITVKMVFYNPLLINALNRYHPYLLYLSWLYIPALLMLYLHNIKKLTTISYPLKKLALGMTIIVALTLSLGSWWAYQEGSWGGWWNWDPSEVFGLLIGLLVLMSLHRILFNGFTGVSAHTMLPLLGIAFIYYSFMQVNFTLISHNFGFRDNDLLDIKNFYLILIGLVFTYIVRWLVNFSSVYSRLFYHVSRRNYKLLLVMLSYVCATALSVPLLTLVNDFIWRLFSVNASNSAISYHVLSIVLVIIYMFTYNSRLVTLVFILLQFAWGTGNQLFLWLALAIPIILRNKFYYAHYIFIFVIVYNIELHDYFISLWSCSPTSFDASNAQAFLYGKIRTCVDYPYLHLVHMSSHINDTSAVSLYFTVPDTKNFSLLQSNSYTLQALTSDHSFLQYELASYEYSLSLISSLTLMFFIIVALIFSNLVIIL
jgi:cytochrome c biogenesis factor